MPRLYSLFRVICLVTALAPGAAIGGEATVAQWDSFEITLAGPADGNPFVDTQLSAVFSDGNHDVEVAGFYDAQGIYRIRFMPDQPGAWRYETHSNRRALTGKTGELVVTPAKAGDHGPVRVHDTYHFAYADGTPFVPIGTTLYNWMFGPVAEQDQTVKTLAGSPFNKVRMLVLPSNGAVHGASPVFPFEGSAPTHWDFTRFDPVFFRRIESRLEELRAIGVEADLILFHPYGAAWGYDAMSAADDDRYVRYVVARFAAYRNVWWSLANEYDFIRTRQESDWDRLFQVVQQSDPYDHLRSIHNGARLYNNNQPWVTHASIQNGAAVEESGRAELYRDVYRKPIVYDEVKYEGHIARRWGQLTAEELVHRFWAGTVAGTYVGHGEVLRGPTGSSWLSSGGTMVGASPARIAFLKQILADAPEIDPVDKWQDTAIGGKAGEYYLVYFGENAPGAWTFRLPQAGVADGQTYRVDVIDPWQMTVAPVSGEFTTKRRDRYTFVDAGGRSVSLPGKPYLALRIRRVGGTAAAAAGEQSNEP